MLQIYIYAIQLRFVAAVEQSMVVGRSSFTDSDEGGTFPQRLTTDDQRRRCPASSSESVDHNGCAGHRSFFLGWKSRRTDSPGRRRE
jgi:hypothetical protein